MTVASLAAVAARAGSVRQAGGRVLLLPPWAKKISFSWPRGAKRLLLRPAAPFITRGLLITKDYGVIFYESVPGGVPPYKIETLGRACRCSIGQQEESWSSAAHFTFHSDGHSVLMHIVILLFKNSINHNQITCKCANTSQAQHSCVLSSFCNPN
jgi:hypothetical protein